MNSDKMPPLEKAFHLPNSSTLTSSTIDSATPRFNTNRFYDLRQQVHELVCAPGGPLSQLEEHPSKVSWNDSMLITIKALQMYIPEIEGVARKRDEDKWILIVNGFFSNEKQTRIKMKRFLPQIESSEFVSFHIREARLKLFGYEITLSSILFMPSEFE